MNRDVTIYALREPDTDVVRYVGATCWLKMRVGEHEAGSKTPTQKWAKKLLRKGWIPSVKVLDVVPPSMARETENKWIRRYLRKGKLLNKMVVDDTRRDRRSLCRLIRVAKSAGLSLRDIAKELHCSVEYIRSAAMGRCSISLKTVRKIEQLTKSDEYKYGFAARVTNWPLIRRDRVNDRL